MTEHNAIETSYAGCRFRSRLEARWAIVFDELGLEWVYEPQGYLVGPPAGLDSDKRPDPGDQRPYLPDFWLPERREWVEVKGSPLRTRECRLLAHATVPHKDWGLPDNRKGILLLGPIPEPRRDVVALHGCLYFHNGDLYRGYEFLGDEETWFDGFVVLHQIDECGFDIPYNPSRWNSGWNLSPMLVDSVWITTPAAQRRVERAYAAGRSARFEHGERR
jgi:hypothetical protein